MRNLPFVAIAATALVALGGCATLHKTDHDYHKANQTAQRDLKAKPKIAQVVQTHGGAFLAGRQIKAKPPLPAFMRDRVVLQTSQPLTLTQVASKISSLIGLPVSVTMSAQQALEESAQRSSQLSEQLLMAQQLVRRQGGPNRPPNMSGNQHYGSMRVHWNGSVKGLLNYVASRAGVFWRYDAKSDSIRFYLTETRVYHISALSGQSTFNSSVSNASTGGISSSSSGGSSSGGGQGGTSQTVGNSATVNIYKDVVGNVKTILAQLSSSNSVVKIPTSVSDNPGTGTVTVTATPPVLNQVAQYIAQINQGLTKQVLINVHVYQVELDNTANYGLNLTAAFKSSGAYSASGQGPGIPGVLSTSATPGNLAINVLTGKFAKSAALVQALSTQGKVSLVTSASVLALNGQPAPIQVAQQQGYLASASLAQSANVGTTTSLTPGTITTGFSANFMPLILQNQNVLLQYSVNLSSLLGLQTVKSGGAEIQTPNVSVQAFLQRALLKNQQTLVLTGFEQTSDTSSRNGVGSAHNWALGGGYSAEHKRTALVISIHVTVI